MRTVIPVSLVVEVNTVDPDQAKKLIGEQAKAWLNMAHLSRNSFDLGYTPPREIIGERPRMYDRMLEMLGIQSCEVIIETNKAVLDEELAEKWKRRRFYQTVQRGEEGAWSVGPYFKFGIYTSSRKTIEQV
jgi:hypothetical protein